MWELGVLPVGMNEGVLGLYVFGDRECCCVGERVFQRDKDKRVKTGYGGISSVPYPRVKRG